MIRIFIPVAKGRKKTSVRGFWRSADNRTYYDYIEVVNTNYITTEHLEAIRKQYNQEAITIVDNGTMKIFYKDIIEVLSSCITGEVKRNNLKKTIKKALKEYGGITIYRSGQKFFKEIYFND